MSASKKLVVCGGNGFLGSRICKYGVARGWEVTSISRSGEPQWNTVETSSTPPEWAHKVSWQRADVFRPATYAPFLKGADFVVHTMGILVESDYKNTISGRKPDGSENPNPLERTKEDSAAKADAPAAAPTDGSDPKKQLSYEMMNRDSAIMLAREADREGASAFGFVSAAGGVPGLPRRYITTKREAESTLTSEFPRMRSIFFRAGLMYDDSRSYTKRLMAIGTVGHAFNRLTLGVLSGFLGNMGAKPLPTEVVAKGVIEALANGTTKGPVEVPQLEELAKKTPA